jgi:hypothetical protein
LIDASNHISDNFGTCVGGIVLGRTAWRDATQFSLGSDSEGVCENSREFLV